MSRGLSCPPPLVSLICNTHGMHMVLNQPNDVASYIQLTSTTLPRSPELLWPQRMFMEIVTLPL